MCLGEITLTFFTQHTTIQPNSVNLSTLAFQNFFLYASTWVVLASTDTIVASFLFIIIFLFLCASFLYCKYLSWKVPIEIESIPKSMHVRECSSLILDAKQQWKIVFKALSRKCCQPIIFQPAKVSIKCDVKKK